VLEARARVVEPTRALVVTDDIYARILLDGRRFASMAQLGPEWAARTVVVNGVSKGHAMTGFRIGWAAGPREVVAAMGRVQDQSTSTPVSFAQMGALAAVTGPQDCVDEMVCDPSATPG
jgi:aspartate aminotransferase